MIDIWYFWNHCHTGKHYPSRPTKRVIIHPEVRTVNCSECGRSMVSYGNRMKKNGRWLCYQCREDEKKRIEKAELSEIREKSERKLLEFQDRLSNCEKFGTCDILAAHHDVLADDPERLSSEFMIGLICGEQGRLRYIKNGRAIPDGAI